MDHPRSVTNRLLTAIAEKFYLRWAKKISWYIFHVVLPPDADSKKIRLGHCVNIIISPDVKIGHSHFGNHIGIPELSNDVIVYPNAVIIGNVYIGEKAIIGAGAIVVKDVPDRTIVVGNPARQVGKVLSDKKISSFN